ncbi:unnamed protein product [Closterium sp. NIES-53]
MASLRVLAFDHEGLPIQFDTWLDDLQLYLLSDYRDSVSLFDHTSGASPAPPATADSATRSHWLTRDAAACLAIRNHLPLAECAHFGQHRTALALYDAVVARYSSPATAALSRLLLPYLFLEPSIFATVEDLVSHLRTSDARYRTAASAEFLHRNQPPMFITLYFLVTRLPDSLCSVRDNILSLDPTVLTVDLLEQHLLAAETSVVAVGAARGTPRTPFFEGCSPSPLAPSYASVAAVYVPGAEDIGAASASGKRRSSKGKVLDSKYILTQGWQEWWWWLVGAAVEVVEAMEAVAVVGVVAGVGALVESAVAAVGVEVVAAVGVVAVGLELLSVERGASGGSGSCPYVIRTGDRAGQTCGKPHIQHRCFSRLDDAWRAEFGDEAERPRWAELLRSGVAIFDLDYDVILAAMYALSVSAEGDCYLFVPPDPGIEAAALGASESVLPSTATAEALHTFTIYSGASRCFFRDSTTLTPLSALVPVRLADPSGGPVLARSSVVLPCPAVSSSSLSIFHLPSFSTNLVSTAAFQDALVTTTTPGGQRVSICTCTRTGCHLATFTRRPGSSQYTLATESAVHTGQVAASAQVSASGQVATTCSCRLLTHQSLLWHHCLGHPSLPRLCGMHFRLLVSGLPRSQPPLPPSPAPPCLPCVEGRQRAAPHSSSFPPTTAPLQTLHMDVKGQFPDVLIPWIRAVRLQICERFRHDLLVLRLHSNKGGEFSSDLLRDFCCGEGILQSFTPPDSPQQNGIAERRIGLVMEVARTSMIHAAARTSMIHAAAPHFLWPFAVRYAAHQLNLWPRVSLPKTSPTLRWTGKVGDASVFRVWGSRAFVCDTSADKLSARAIACVFLGFSPDAHGWQFYHPTLRCVSPSQDVPLDESVPFYRLFPYRSAPPLPPPLFLAPGPPPVDPLPPQGPAPSGVSQEDPLPGTAPVEVAVGLGAARGAASWGAEPGGAESEGVGSGGAELGSVEPGGAEPGGAEPAGVEPGGAELGGVEPGGTESEGAESGGAEPRDSAAGDTGARGAKVTAGAGGAGGAATACPGGARTRGTASSGTGGVGGAGARDPTEPGAAGAGGARAVGTGAGGTSAGGAGAGGAGAVDPGAGGAGGTKRPRPRSHRYSQPSHCLLLLLTLSRPAVLQSVVSMRLVLHRVFALVVAFLVRVPLLSPARILWHFVLPLFHCVFLCRFLLSPLLLPSLTLTAACCLDYATALVAESESASPPSVGGEISLGTDVLDDTHEDFECLAAAVPRFASMLLDPEGDPDAPDIPTPRSYAEAITGPYSSQWLAAMDAEMASWKSTGTYIDAVPPSRASIVDAMWIFRVKRPPGSPPSFKARYVAIGFGQRQGVDYFRTFSPTPKMTNLWVLLHVAAQCDYELHSLDFSIGFLQGSLHEEIWLRCSPGFTGSFPADTQWSLRRPVYGLRQAPHEWHDTLRTTLAALGFTVSTADPSLFLRTDTSLPPFYVLVYIDDLVFASADTEALTLVKSELQKRHTCTDLDELRSYLGLQITWDRAWRTII